MKKKIVSLSLAAILSLQATTFCFAEEYPDQNRQDEKISFIQKNIDLNTVSPYAIQDTAIIIDTIKPILNIKAN